MGYDTGTFKDINGSEYGVEVTCGMVIIEESKPYGQVIRIYPTEADKLFEALDLAVNHYLGLPEDRHSR